MSPRFNPWFKAGEREMKPRLSMHRSNSSLELSCCFPLKVPSSHQTHSHDDGSFFVGTAELLFSEASKKPFAQHQAETPPVILQQTPLRPALYVAWPHLAAQSTPAPHRIPFKSNKLLQFQLID
mmetsp:Transcript_11458/g.18552  ORF Transcript_11458/g.18552 Transcript_11458/m.18552 type:complete len:124 (-) Transcript_11458:474-845(-)